MIAIAAIPSSPSSPPRSLVLSAALHGLLLAAWMFAPAPILRDLGPGPLSVELLVMPPPPEPEVRPAPPAQTPPAPTPAAPPRQEAAKPVAKPRPATPQPAPTAAPAQPAAQPVTTDIPAPAPPAENAAPAPAAAAIPTPAGRSAERDDYVRMVWTRIMRFRPERVPFAGLTRLRFTLGADGTLVAVELAESSGSGLLDRTALDAVRRAAPFPAPPPGVPADALTFEIPFQFR